MAMSSQWGKLARMDACVSGSAAWKFPMVWSEKTTPQPKVSSGRFRSYTSTRSDGSALRSRIAAYSPAGPPPRHTIRLILAVPLVAAISPALYHYHRHQHRPYVILPSTSSVNYSLTSRHSPGRLMSTSLQTLAQLVGGIVGGGSR